MRDGREGHLARLLDVAQPGDAQALPALAAGRLLAAQARDLRQRLDAADAGGGRLPGLAVAQARLAVQRPVAVERRRRRDDLPGAAGLGHADGDHAAARGGEPVDRLAQGDGVGGAPGERVVATSAMPAVELRRKSERLPDSHPRAASDGARALDGRAQRAAGAHERRGRAELVPGDLVAPRSRTSERCATVGASLPARTSRSGSPFGLPWMSVSAAADPASASVPVRAQASTNPRCERICNPLPRMDVAARGPVAATGI